MNKEDEINRLPLYMPNGLKLRKEYFRGFGKEELRITLIAGFIFLLIDVILFFLVTKNAGVLFFFPLCGTSAVGMMNLKSDVMNMSPVDIIKQDICFRKSQKLYLYVKKNEFENIK